MILIIFFALLGGVATFLITVSEGLLYALVVTPLGASAMAATAAGILTLSRAGIGLMRSPGVDPPRRSRSWR